MMDRADLKQTFKFLYLDVDGHAMFDGTLTTGTSDWAHLSYYHAESGEAITLN